MERREQVTRVAIKQSQRVKPEELAGLDGRRQSSMGGTSRMNREIQVRICERLGVKFPGPTRRKCQIKVPSRISLGEQKANIWTIIPSWVASGHRRYGSGMQAKFAANARLPFHPLIGEANGFARAARE